MTDCQPPEFILPNNKETPVAPLHLNGIKSKVGLARANDCSPSTSDAFLYFRSRSLVVFQQPPCLKQLTFSGWNPPPGKRKMKGDLMYLHIITMEDKRYHVTASTKGFFVNQ